MFNMKLIYSTKSESICRKPSNSQEKLNISENTGTYPIGDMISIL